VNLLELINPPNVFIEIGPSSLQLLEGNEGLELPLERQENGLLSPACKASVAARLRDFLRQPGWRPRRRAFCAIGARGVSLRRLKLPATGKEEWQRLLRMQIESEFPLPPDELAWGCRPLGDGAPRSNGSPQGQEWMVAAVKKEVVEDYAELLAGCGLDPIFTLGALARGGLCPQAPDSYAILEVGSEHTELIAYEQGVPAWIRILPWGETEITRSIEKQLGVGRDEAEQLKARARQLPSGDLTPNVQAAIQTGLAPLAKSIQAAWSGKKLYLAGAGSASLAPWFCRALGETVVCEPLGRMPGPGRSAAILGLRQCCEQNGGAPPLILETQPTERQATRTRSATWTWAVLALALALGAFSLRYTEAFLHQRGLAKKLAEVKAARNKLPNIDPELNFLQYLKTNQPPYLEALSILAKAAPSGLRLESLAMSRRGDLSLKGFVRDMPQTLEFRTNLIRSGFFSSVVFVEQTPIPNQQKMTMRLEAIWQPTAARDALAAELSRAENNLTNAPAQPAKPSPKN
jgi:hypothetical protein